MRRIIQNRTLAFLHNMIVPNKMEGSYMPQIFAEGEPTKYFFINMLTRDIDLKDAILDLLDNCLDGVVRMQKGIERKNRSFYQGFSARIDITDSFFQISDNCGGIPKKDLLEKAFRWGRNENETEDSATVGIYGIGLKRAIFKIGHCAQVITRNGKDTLKVSIDKEWAATDGWKIPVEEIEPSEISDCGTIVKVWDYTTNVYSLWKESEQRQTFIDDLVSSIVHTYGLIIDKGFEIYVNDLLVESEPIKLLVSNEESGIKPYIFQAMYGSVSVKLTIGFYVSPPTEEELDQGTELTRSSSNEAGWTIICNDRVILHNDKSYLTGWGEAGIPQYHTQFSSIRGFVFFESNNPKELPMTSTKRGIDLSSPIYAAVKNHMRDGLKMFVNYTNKWKGRQLEERTKFSRRANEVSYSDIIVNDSDFNSEYKISFKSTSDGKIFRPDLPLPQYEKPYVRIVFSKPKEDVNTVLNFFYNDATVSESPSTIGEKCFDYVYERAKEHGGF